MRDEGEEPEGEATTPPAGALVAAAVARDRTRGGAHPLGTVPPGDASSSTPPSSDETPSGAGAVRSPAPTLGAYAVGAGSARVVVNMACIEANIAAGGRRLKGPERNREIRDDVDQRAPTKPQQQPGVLLPARLVAAGASGRRRSSAGEAELRARRSPDSGSGGGVKVARSEEDDELDCRYRATERRGQQQVRARRVDAVTTTTRRHTHPQQPSASEAEASPPRPSELTLEDPLAPVDAPKPGSEAEVSIAAAGGDVHISAASAAAEPTGEKATRPSRAPRHPRVVEPRSAPPTIRGHLLHSVITTTVDSLWQVSPRRVLEYSPGALHNVGWLPLTSWYNLGVTVFASWTLHAQTAALCAWMLLIQLTGLGVPVGHQRHFCIIFGSQYLGSLASMGTIITLVLGLFISLVVSRWWDMRVQYAQMHSVIVDLALTFVQQMESADEDGAQRIAEIATSEFLRLLNLIHVLFLSQAGEKEGTIATAKALQWGARHASRVRSRDGMESPHPTPTASSVRGGSAWFRRGDEPTNDRKPHSDNRREHSAIFVGDDVLGKHPAKLAMEDCAAMGLVTEDEWERLAEAQAAGMPRFMTASCWAGSEGNDEPRPST